MVSDGEPAAPLPPAVVLTGPTAAGKTGVALTLARRLPVRIVSVDSAQVYRGLDIGSAKPDAATLERFPHALIDIRNPEEAYSAAEFAADCEQAMRSAWDSGRMPLLVGGTTLYLRALLYGLDPMPPADPAVRRRIASAAARRGWGALHAKLARLDPVTADAIAVGDTQRIQRALEILELTGQPPSRLRRGNRIPRIDSLRLVLTPSSRHVLHQRIDQRLDQMIENGLIDEVAGLRQRNHLSLDVPSMRSVGYRQVWQYLDGSIDRTRMRLDAATATRRLAKRQLTALRQVSNSLWYDPDRAGSTERICLQVEKFIRRFSHTAPR